MDYLYDKVETYDHLKAVIQGKALPDALTDIQYRLQDIEHHMLHFLDNHDEQRLASKDFAGTSEKGKPLMVVSATLSSSPTMVYFGQEVGEPGNEEGGFGKPTRTSIFDYIGVPHHQRWMNEGKFDGGKLSKSEKELRDFYSRLLNFTLKSSALTGRFLDLQKVNRAETSNYDPGIYAFARYSTDEKLLVIANFSWVTTSNFSLKIPADAIKKLKIADGEYKLTDALYGKQTVKMVVANGVGIMDVKINPSESFIFKIE
jgi:glycosidase